MKLPRRQDYFHVIDLPVRWGDMDRLGHVNNAKYFTYAESARIAYFETVVDGESESGKGNGQGPILANIGCDFLSQLRYPAQMEIGTRVTRIGRSSLQVEHAVFSDGRAIASLDAVVVWFDYDGQKSAPLPETVRTLIVEREQGRIEQAK